MNGFDLVSRLFGLVLGLAIADLIKDFVRVWRLKRGLDDPGAGTEIRIGWLVPLLGTLIIIDLTTFWFNFNELGAHLPTNLAGLAAIMVVMGAYYALSTLIFPRDPSQWPDYDDYYMKIRRTVVGGMLAINLIGLAYELILQVGGSIKVESGSGTPISDFAEILGVVALVVLLFIESKRGNLIVLALANILTLCDGLPF